MLPNDFLDLRRSDFVRRRARAPRHGLRPGRQQRAVLRELHQSLPATRSSRDSGARRSARRPTPRSRFDLRWSGAGGAGGDRAAVFESQRRPPGVRARRLSLHRPRRRRLRRRSRSPRAESAGAAREDAAHRRQRRRQSPDRLPGACRQSVRARAARLRRGPRSGRSDFATRGATASTTRRAAGPARSSSATSARAPSRKSTTNRADAADGTTAGATVKARTTTSRRGRRRFCRSSIRFTSTAARRDSRSPADTSIAAARSVRRITGRYFFADYVAGRVWSLALTIDSQGEARASDLVEHTVGARRPESARQHQLLRQSTPMASSISSASRAGRYSALPA